MSKKRISNIYANGCSFVNGFDMWGIPGKDTIKDLHNLPSFKVEKAYEYSRTHTFVHCLASMLGVQYYNKSRGASPNERIIEDTMDWVLKYPDEERLVIVGLTCPSRIRLRPEQVNYDLTYLGKDNMYFYPRDIADNTSITNKDLPIDVDKHTEKYIANKANAMNSIYFDMFETDDFYNLSERWLREIFLLSTFLDKYNHKYIIFQSLGKNIFQLNHARITNINSQIKKNKNIITNETFWEFSIKNNYPISSAKHPLEKAHKKWAYRLLDNLKENKIV